MRTCADCGMSMQPYLPRTRLGDGRMVCGACAKSPRGGLVSAQGSQARPGEDAVAFETGTQHVWDTTRHNGTTEPLCERHRDLAAQHAEAQQGLAQDAGIPTDPRSTFSIGEHRRAQCADCRREQPALLRGLTEPNSSRMDTPPRKADWPYSDQKRRTRKPFEPGFSTQNVRKQAHDPGDGVTVAHCPFCGSGQVIARSDNAIQCDFCDQQFTVTVQPQWSAFPQTVDGQPVQVPGVPGSGQPDPMDPGMSPGVDDAVDIDGDGLPDGTPPMADGGADDAEGDGNPFASGDSDDEGDSGSSDDSDDSDSSGSDNQPPWLKNKKSYRTLKGAELGVDDYLRHLALQYTDDRELTLAIIRKERNG